MHAFVFVKHPSIIDFVSPLAPMGLCVDADLIFDVFLVLPLAPMLCLNSYLILGEFLTLIREHSFSSYFKRQKCK